METPSTTAVTASLFPCPVPVSTLQAFAVAFTKGHVFTTMIGPGTEPEDGAASDGRARMAMAMAMAPPCQVLPGKTSTLFLERHSRKAAFSISGFPPRETVSGRPRRNRTVASSATGLGQAAGAGVALVGKVGPSRKRGASRSAPPRQRTSSTLVSFFSSRVESRTGAQG